MNGEAPSTAGPPVKLALRDIRKSYGGTPAVDGVSLDVIDGEFLVLLGPSGCGKTTLLRMIAGFVRPDGGSILLDGEEIASARSNLAPERRKMAMVFQSYALWPNKTIFENVAFGLRIRKRPRREIGERVAEALRLVNMAGYEKRYPSQLSGGEQQRIALARAVVVRPAVFLFDEPLSNLDASLREVLRFELKELQVKLGVTSIYVTHDQAEAMVMADRMAVFYKGKIQQLGTAKEIYERPAASFVSGFVGHTNLIRGRLSVRADGNAEFAEVETELGFRLHVPADGMISCGGNGQIGICARPENLILARRGQAGRLNQFEARVVRKIHMGGHTDYRVAIGSWQLRVQTHPDQDYEIGETVFVWLDPARCHCMPEDSP